MKGQLLTSMLGGDLAVLVILAFAGLMFTYSYISPQGLVTQFSASNYTTVTNTTIRIIQSGKYISALDKQGTGGTLYALQAVKVLDVRAELDGDFHVTVSDGANTLETEFTPYYMVKYNQVLPKVNQTIDIIGIYYCDPPHQADPWHSQGTCAELHPVRAWAISPYMRIAGNFTFVPESGLNP